MSGAARDRRCCYHSCRGVADYTGGYLTESAERESKCVTALLSVLDCEHPRRWCAGLVLTSSRQAAQQAQRITQRQRAGGLRHGAAQFFLVYCKADLGGVHELLCRWTEAL